MVPNLSVGQSGIRVVSEPPVGHLGPGSPKRLGDVIEDQLTWWQTGNTLKPSKKKGGKESHLLTMGVFRAKRLLVLTSPKNPGNHWWVERHCQGNLDIQPINRCNQLDFCPSRAVAFQCPETSNRRKWQVESYLGCLLKICRRSEIIHTKHTQV